MSIWKREALKAGREELWSVPLKGLGILKKLEKPLICTPANPSLGFLAKEQVQLVESLPNDMRRMDQVIDFLVDMEDKCFEHFCKILEQSGYGSKANMLRKKAEELKAAFGK